MKKAMILTIGTGINSEKGSNNIAQALNQSINNCNPEEIVFIVTPKSKEITLFKIKKLLNIDHIKETLIEDLNDFNSIYSIITNEIKSLKKRDYHITIDYTSGTKAMSAAACTAGVLEFCDLSYIGGRRGKNNIVISGREKISTFKPIDVFISFQKKLLKHLFNQHQFDAGIEIINKIKSLTNDPEIVDECNRYIQLFDGYSKWDKFNHEGACDILRTFDNSIVDIKKNKQYLLLLKKVEYKEELLIPDLYNNAKRRFKEGKYDDAVARLYRCIEMIGQYQLKKVYGINTSDTNIKHLEEKKIQSINHYRKKADINGGLKLALSDSYRLLRDLDDDLGKKILNNIYKDILQKRNNSILAHGLVPVGKDDAEKMIVNTKDLTNEVIKDIDRKIVESEFPKL